MKNTQHYKHEFIEIDGNNYHVEIDGKGKPFFLLHGFSEDCTTWCKIGFPEYTSYRIDLIGHGKTDKPDEQKYYRLETILEQMHTLIHSLTSVKYSIMGYSMGGRIALAYACKYSAEIDRLILESSGVGLTNEFQRLKRLQSDFLLSERIIKNGIHWFQEYWAGLEIFDTQRKLSADVCNEIQQRRLRNSPEALANILTGCGQGVFPYYGDKLHQLPMPILYISGGLDKKYSKIGEQLAKGSFNVKFVQIENAGHNVHLEQPNDFQKTVWSFLNDAVYIKQ